MAIAATGLGFVLQQSVPPLQQQKASTPLLSPLNKAVLLPKPRPLPPKLEFISHKNQPFTNTNFQGRWTVLFFAFTHCPDICPNTLHQLKLAKEIMLQDAAWNNIQVVMMSVDPARDTTERLNKYVPYFDPDFIGLTGNLTQITEFAKKVGVLFVHHDPDDNGNYDIDHSAALILINPKGEFAGVISAPHEANVLAEDLQQITDQNSSKLNSQENINENTSASLENLWIRPAPPGVTTMAAYGTIRNNFPEILEIVSASSPLFDEVIFHATNINNGIASMNSVDTLSIAPKTHAQLKPMGTHIMLIDALNEVAIGDLVPIYFILRDGSQLQGLFEVGFPKDFNEQ